MPCPRCNTKKRQITASEAAALYARLKDRLRVVDAWGCYTPKRGRATAGDHTAWPLHHWRGPGTFPLVVEFSGKPGKHPTFDQFCKVYNLEPVE